MLRLLAAAIAILVLAPACLTALHLGVVAIASLTFRERFVKDPPHVTFLIVIPAHNEERLLGATLDALQAARRAGDQVMVVDDRSTDLTAEIAAAHGCIVVSRVSGDEPGRAAARRAGIKNAAPLTWDALVMIDADSLVDQDFLARCEAALASGALALQARSEAARGPRLVDLAALASFAIQGVTLPRGRQVLGLPVRLRGTGMVLRREVVDTLDFRAQASEDLQVSLDLLRDGIRTHHVDAARLRSANADSWRIASEQKERYEAGRTHAARTYVPSLLALHSGAGLESAIFLLTPPFAVAVALVVLAVPFALLAAWTPLIWIVLGATAAMTFVFVTACVQGRVGWRILLALLAAPWYISWKLIVQMKAIVGLRGGLKEFGATDRL